MAVRISREHAAAVAARDLAAERAEAENYERVGHFLSILKSKARTSVRARNGS